MATDTTRESSRSAGSDIKEQGSELVNTAQEQVAARASEVGDDLAFKLRDQVDLRSTQAGDQLQAIAGAMRSARDDLRAEGKASTGDVLEGVARRVEHLGSYLKSTDADRILGDAEEFARNRPWIAGSVAAVAGFVAARFLKASSERRFEATRSADRRSSYLELDQGVVR
jgi:ElaB/YqjD/DUF883 family membrane-anchored ribosome-binding protein